MFHEADILKAIVYICIVEFLTKNVMDLNCVYIFNIFIIVLNDFFSKT